MSNSASDYHPLSAGWGCGADQRAKTLTATLDE